MATTEETENAVPMRVTVVNMDMHFGTMVLFMVKLAIAAIPAAIILGVIGAIVFGLIGSGIGGLSGRF
jgi:hypothetical protein